MLRADVHSWLARYEVRGLEGLVDRSHRPVRVRIRWRLPCWILRTDATR